MPRVGQVSTAGEWFRDLSFLAGLGLVGYASWRIWSIEVAALVTGSILMGLAVVSAVAYWRDARRE